MTSTFLSAMTSSQGSIFELGISKVQAFGKSTTIDPSHRESGLVQRCLWSAATRRRFCLRPRNFDLLQILCWMDEFPRVYFLPEGHIRAWCIVQNFVQYDNWGSSCLRCHQV